jgi:acetylornithine/succinyldiaminopimelate/putrescine aminotransferase
MTALQAECDLVRDVRVLGVMIGVELAIDGTNVVQGCMDRNLLINCTHGTVLRLLPAINLSPQQAHDGCDILAEVVKQQASN